MAASAYAPVHVRIAKEKMATGEGAPAAPYSPKLMRLRWLVPGSSRRSSSTPIS